MVQYRIVDVMFNKANEALSRINLNYFYTIYNILIFILLNNYRVIKHDVFE